MSWKGAGGGTESSPHIRRRSRSDRSNQIALSPFALTSLPLPPHGLNDTRKEVWGLWLEPFGGWLNLFGGTDMDEE